jgi:hypothetical protein
VRTINTLPTLALILLAACSTDTGSDASNDAPPSIAGGDQVAPLARRHHRWHGGVTTPAPAPSADPSSDPTPAPTPAPAPTTDPSTTPPSATPPSTTPPTATPSKAAALTAKLGPSHAGHFLVGMGQDSGDAFTLGVTFDMRYHYLTGISSEGGWPSWQKSPDYAQEKIRQAKAHGVVPMLTLYQLAAHGDGNPSVLTDDAFLATFFKDYALLLADIAGEGGPVILHLEPDFWGYAGQWSLERGGMANVTAHVSGRAPECAGLPNDVTGLAKCMLAMARSRAPNAIVGFHASPFGTNQGALMNTNPSFDVVADATKLAAQCKQMGFDAADLFMIDGLDRDAGCYEAGYATGGETVCGVSGGHYWDETNTKLPHFRQFFTWAKTISDALKLPFMIWQISSTWPKK